MNAAYWDALGAPYYTIEPLRQDAKGRWTREFRYVTPVSRAQALAAIRQFAASTRDRDALLTGYLTGDEGVETVERMGFVRDPHPEAAYRTLPPQEYDVLAEQFATQHELRPEPNKLMKPFRVLLGRVPGFSEQPPYSMDEVAACFRGAGMIALREVHFFAARYDHDSWDEPAVEIRGELRELPLLARAARRLQQARFVCEAVEQTVV